MTGGAGKKTAAGAFVVLLVVAAFLLRRVGGPGSAPGFDAAQYRDAPVVAADEAERHVGERARVCGTVVATNFVPGVDGAPTFLNLERPYPEQPFDIVIWGSERPRFERPPEILYRGRRVCVSGRVSEYEGVPRIEVSTPEQIRIRSR